MDVSQLDISYLGSAFDNLDMNTFAVGYNSASNIYIFDKDWYWQVERHVGGQNVVLMVNKDRGYNIVLTQNGTTINIRNQDSTTNNIIIKQSK